MSEQKQTDTKLKPIPVKRLRFPDQPLDIPGKSGVSGIVASDPELVRAGNLQRWELEYHPWIRAFRIAFFKPNTPIPEVLFVPEARCTWEPMPQ